MPWKSCEAKIAGQTFILHPLKALYWAEQDALLIADLHLGKARHFRREGFPVPMGVADANTDKLISLLLDFTPQRVIFLGDLFHSDYNEVWEDFGELLQQFSQIQFDLVIGNHDRLSDHAYRKVDLSVHPDSLQLANVLLTHEPQQDLPPEVFNLAGHIHPAVQLRGRGRQYLKLPCFYFGENAGLLPAFGSFTGTATIPVREGDRVYVVSGEAVVEM